MIKNLLNAVVVDGNGSSINVNSKFAGGVKTAQLSVTIAGGTGTVTIQGRLSSTDTWVPLAAGITASGGSTIPLWPHMRAVVSSISGATISANLYTN